MIRTHPYIGQIHPKTLTGDWEKTTEHGQHKEVCCVTPRCRAAQTPAIVSLIGQTPLVPLAGVAANLPPAVDLYVKLEGFNPGGSVKDRAALSIVQEALRTGELTPGKTLLDATSGNTGISFAMLGAAMGFPVELVMPADVSPERMQILRAYGAELVLSDPASRTDGARQMACQMVTAEPDRYFYADQYNNPANPLAHYETTGVEILDDFPYECIDFLVVGIGTGGTLMGVARKLKEKQPEVKVIGVEPPPGDSIQGLRCLEDYVPPILDLSFINQRATVNSQQATAGTRELLQKEGIFAGFSSGANVAAAVQLLEGECRGATIVTMMCDSGLKYLSTDLWA